VHNEASRPSRAVLPHKTVTQPAAFAAFILPQLSSTSMHAPWLVVPAIRSAALYVAISYFVVKPTLQSQACESHVWLPESNAMLGYCVDVLTAERL
jgi:hypothetical protein